MSTKHTPALARIDSGSKVDDAFAVLGAAVARGEQTRALLTIGDSHADLLALCKKALTTSARVHPDFEDELRAAIAKAEGK